MKIILVCCFRVDRVLYLTCFICVDYEGGHYNAYTRHGIKAEWCLFDDYKVTKVINTMNK
jgi:ubiquitin C-terminal hydrolase